MALEKSKCKIISFNSVVYYVHHFVTRLQDLIDLPWFYNKRSANDYWVFWLHAEPRVFLLAKLRKFFIFLLLDPGLVDIGLSSGGNCLLRRLLVESIRIKSSTSSTCYKRAWLRCHELIKYSIMIRVGASSLRYNIVIIIIITVIIRIIIIIIKALFPHLIRSNILIKFRQIRN